MTLFLKFYHRVIFSFIFLLFFWIYISKITCGGVSFKVLFKIWHCNEINLQNKVCSYKKQSNVEFSECEDVEWNFIVLAECGSHACAFPVFKCYKFIYLPFVLLTGRAPGRSERFIALLSLIFVCFMASWLKGISFELLSAGFGISTVKLYCLTHNFCLQS